MAIGAVMAPSGLILASLATSPWHIYLSQGILFGVGSGFCFASALALPSQFFKKHRALATGISVSGSGFGGMALSPMTEGLISTMGYRNALRVQGGMGFGILFLATALGFSKVRPGGHEGGKGRKFVIVDWSIMSCDLLLLMMFCLLVTFSYPACYYYIPQYTNYIGLDAVHGAFLISITAASNSLSRISMGFLADRLGNMNVMLGCSLASGLFTSLLWQFSSSYGAYTVYCVFCGLTVGVFVSLLPMVIADIVGVLNIQHGIGFCYSTMVFGVLLGAPISGKLLQNYSWTVAIQFIGATTLVASLFLGWLRMKQTKGKLLMII
ncbi:major facilitator superfamily domain-containing protein [Chlamydoabsidia padenii]|nr:major facilitator superfamily domain-containing protein [Chlamydoabsidia padenii]